MKKPIPGQNSVPGVACDQPLEQVRILQEDWAAIVLCQLHLTGTRLPDFPPRMVPDQPNETFCVRFGRRSREAAIFLYARKVGAGTRGYHSSHTLSLTMAARPMATPAAAGSPPLVPLSPGKTLTLGKQKKCARKEKQLFYTICLSSG